MASHDCPRCQGTMAVGFTLNNTQHSSAKVSQWVEGPPEKSFWLGVKTRGKSVIDIETWRCKRCGFLESYAPA